MAKSATLVVKVLADASKFNASMQNAGSGASKFAEGIKKAALPAAAVGVALVAFGKAAVSSASRLQQAAGGVDSVFKGNAGQIHKWAEGAAQSLGLAKSEYSEFATLIGSQLKNAGVPMGQLGKQTNDLITKGADLAATFGGSTSDAVAALSSALKGEMDPIEKYGISLTQSTINARMAASGTDKLTGKALQAAKAQAIMAEITAQSADATGKFAQEADTAAGQQQRANAEYENAKAALGEALLPAVTAVAQKLGEMANWASRNAGLVQALAGATLVVVGAILAAAAAIKVFTVAMNVYKATMVVARNVQMAWALAVYAGLGPIILVIAAVVALVAVFIILWVKCAAFRNFFIGMWNGIKTVAVAVWRAISAAALAAWAFLTNAARAAGAAVASIFQTVRAAVAGAFNSIRSAAVSVFNAIRAVVASVGAFIRSALSSVANVGRAAFNAIRSVASSAFNAIRGVANSMTNGIRAALNSIRATVASVASYVRNALSAAFNAAKNAASAALRALMGPINAVKNALASVGAAVARVRGWLSSVKVPSWLGKVTGLVGRTLSAPGPTAYAVPRAAVGGRSALTLRPMPQLSAGPLGARGGVVNVTINGAVDPEATARQIKRILSSHSRRIGGSPAGILRTV